MIDRSSPFSKYIDWNVYNKQQSVPEGAHKEMAPQQAMPEEKEPEDFPLGSSPNEKNNKNNFLGLPEPQEFFSPENKKKMINQMIYGFAGGPEMQVVRSAYPVVKGLAQKGAEFIHPERGAEKLRGELGEGTSRENIENLGERVKLAKKSAQEEALIPKRELYGQEGESNILKTHPSLLPETNLPGLTEKISTEHQWGKTQTEFLSKALTKFRETGNTKNFMETAKDIFGVDKFSKEQTKAIRDMLLMPEKRESHYLSDFDLNEFYGKKTKLMQLHKAFEENTSLNNYDKLQSALKERERKLAAKEKAKTLDDPGEAKLDAIRRNIKNLDKDQKSFTQELPEKLQNLDLEFRTKWAKNVGPYEEAPLTIRKLAQGRFTEVSDENIAHVFSKPTKEVKKILQDLGPSASNNILYSALQKVPINDAEKIADTILDLKRTKGFDDFVSRELEDRAKNILKHVEKAKITKKALLHTGAGIAGGALFGPYGAVAGLAAPAILKQGGKYLAEKLRK